jgi:hypothetical protein
VKLPLLECLLLAQSGHSAAESQCPLLGVKQTYPNARYFPRKQTHRRTGTIASPLRNGWGSDADTRTPTRGMLVSCCENARGAVSGQSALQPSNTTKSRRLMQCLLPIEKIIAPQPSWREGAASMSALGQKQTFGDVRTMSALPPKATVSNTAVTHVSGHRSARS